MAGKMQNEQRGGAPIATEVARAIGGEPEKPQLGKIAEAIEGERGDSGDKGSELKRKPVATPAPKAGAVPKRAMEKEAGGTNKRRAGAPTRKSGANDQPATSGPTIEQLKDTIMATAKKDFAENTRAATADVEDRFRGAYEKGSEVAGEVSNFAKGNVEALVESGRIWATGMQDMGRKTLDSTKEAMEVASEDARKIAGVKSPTDFVQLQGEIARRNLDRMMAFGSQASEDWLKLTNAAAAPLSTRFSVAAEKVGKAA